MKKYIFCIFLALSAYVYASEKSTSYPEPGTEVDLSVTSASHYYYIEKSGTYKFKQSAVSGEAQNVEIIVGDVADPITNPITINMENLSISNVTSDQPIVKIKNATDVTLNIEGKNILRRQNSYVNPMIRLLNAPKQNRRIRITGTGTLILSSDTGKGGFVSGPAVIGEADDTLIVSGSPTVVPVVVCRKKDTRIPSAVEIGHVDLREGTLLPLEYHGNFEGCTYGGAIHCSTFAMSGGQIPAANPSAKSSFVGNCNVYPSKSFFESAEVLNIAGGTFYGQCLRSGFTPNTPIPSACLKYIDASSKPIPTVTADADGLAVIPSGCTLRYASANDEGTAVVFGIPAVATDKGMTARCDFGFTHIRLGADDRPIGFTLAVKLPDGIAEDRTYHIVITETVSPADPQTGASRIVFSDDVRFSFDPAVGRHTATVSTDQTYRVLFAPASRFFRATATAVTHAYSVKALPAKTLPRSAR